MRFVLFVCAFVASAATFGREIAAESYLVEAVDPNAPLTAAVNLPPKPEGEGWRRIANFAGADDSTCIGNPKTPLCAVDTSLSCFMRGDNPLCSIAYGKDITHMRPSEEPAVVDYRVLYFGRYDCGEIYKTADIRCLPPKRGDRLMIVMERDCAGLIQHREWRCFPRDEEHKVFIYLRPVRGLWIVLKRTATRY